MTKTALARVLANAILAAGPIPEEIAARASETLGRHWRWLGPMARRFVKAQSHATRFRQRDVVRFLLADRGFRRHSGRLRIAAWLHEPPRMQPVEAAAAWDIPPLETAADLAVWLGIIPSELDWFANLKGLGEGKLGHYNYLRIGRRIIEAPKPHLKALQRRILKGILDKIPAHPSAHGFVKGRSIATFAAPHVNRRTILKMDLTDFFPSIPAARIKAFFRTAGYPETVADLLGGLCTHNHHLPQGPPTSPALANAILYRLDCRLTGLARSVNAEYTRYADDLAFSGEGDFDKLSTCIAAIAHEEGFEVHHRKTRVMHQGVRQHLAGLTANQKPNIIRTDFDTLKATLTNCLRHGPASQNRDAHPAFQAHLEGRVSFVESINPSKGARLRRILNQISWNLISTY
jgi:retron-type reverse transcriptase